MPGRRPICFLAILTALVMAPSSASAAAPNELVDAIVAPISGEASTPFVLAVRYHSPAGDPAQAVTASVAGVTVPLALLTGTLTDGTWQTTLLLPPGSWSVTYRAATATGSPPVAEVGPVTVVGDGPAPADVPASGPPSVSDGSTGGSTSEPAPRATATPVPSRRPAAQGSAARPTAKPEPAVTLGKTDQGKHERPRPRRSTEPRTSAPPQSAPVAESKTNPPADEEPQDPGSLWIVLLGAAVAVGAVAIFGTAWLLWGGRRERETVVEDAEGREHDMAVQAIPTIEQRAVRRARLRQAQDPILAGMGLEDEATEASPTRPRGARPRR
jgi:hypothetical protein